MWLAYASEEIEGCSRFCSWVDPSCAIDASYWDDPDAALTGIDVVHAGARGVGRSQVHPMLKFNTTQLDAEAVTGSVGAKALDWCFDSVAAIPRGKSFSALLKRR